MSDTSPTRETRSNVAHIFDRVLVVGALISVAHWLSGCLVVCAVLFVLWVFAGSKHGELVAAKPPIVDDFSLYAPPDAQLPNFRVRALPADLIPPFRVEQVTGLCDAAFAPNAQSSFGLAVKLRTPTGDGDEFGIACSHTGAGIDTMADFSEAGALSHPGAERVDVALEHTGTDLIAYARAHAEDGAAELPWREIDRIDVSDARFQNRFLPQVEAFDLNPGAMVSFYDFGIPFNGEYPAGTSSEDRAVRAMVETTIAVVDGIQELDGDDPDAEELRNCLATVSSKIDETRNELGSAAKVARKKRATAEEKVLRKADKKAKSAEKKTDKLVRLFEKKGLDKSKKIAKGLEKIGKTIAKAGDRMLPEDMREAMGGTTLKDLK